MSVVAILDSVINQGEAGSFRPAEDSARLREVRDAVDDLINAANCGKRVLNPDTGRHSVYFSIDDAQRLFAAISRAQGGAGA